MSNRTLFDAAARKCLLVGRKSLPVTLSMDLAAQVLAVDLGLKPALLYDSNCASVEQVQQYLISLQSAHLVSKSLITLGINDNALIVNPAMIITNLERVLLASPVTVINVCHLLEKPSIVAPLSGDLRGMIQDLLTILKQYVQVPNTKKLSLDGDESKNWNLCTLFGYLLGYPVTYWFDQNKGFENCLAMTPLMVIKASVTWKAETDVHRCCLYSFSIPALLHQETVSTLENWHLQLKDRFHQQTVLCDLILRQSIVTLPAVCL